MELEHCDVHLNNTKQQMSKLWLETDTDLFPFRPHLSTLLLHYLNFCELPSPSPYTSINQTQLKKPKSTHKIKNPPILCRYVQKKKKNPKYEYYVIVIF